MANGQYCIELTEEGNWESFENFANHFIPQIGALLIEKIDGPDIRIFKIQYKNTFLNLVYDDYPNGVSIEPINNNPEIINELFSLVKSQSSPNGS